ncbi:MAG: carbonic anhydrase [Bacteroidales bacterium]|jgi:carbonic anhydrase|nr:carbonic anhydrase [Bacteroidales bacterium]
MIHHRDYFELLNNNKLWAAEKLKTDPAYFDELAKPQRPKFLFIGCSDSRVPLTSILESEPGDLFVHRNIANQVNLTDINLLSIIEYAVEILNIEHMIILGHYKCGGVKAAVEGLNEEDIVENWVSQISDIYHYHKKELETITDKGKMYDRISEMNVVAQLKNLLRTPIIQRAFRNKKKLWFHGWIFDIYTGLIKDLPLPLREWKEYDLLPEDYLSEAFM